MEAEMINKQERIAKGELTLGGNWFFENGILTLEGSGLLGNLRDDLQDIWQVIEHVEIGEGWSQLEDYAFAYCESLKSVRIPESMKEIEHGAFGGCKRLREVFFSASLVKIGPFAFAGCEGLETIRLPDGVAEIDSNAFHGCTGLSELHLPEGLKEIGDSAFCHCKKLTEIKIPDGVTTIIGSAFSACTSLTSVEIPNSVVEMDESIFQDCENLSSIVLPDRFVSNMWWLRERKIPAGEDGVAYDKNKRWVLFCNENAEDTCVLADSVIGIADYAFEGCKKLKDIRIPDQLEYLGHGAFSWCDALEGENGILYSTGKRWVLHCRADKEGVCVIPDGVEIIGREAFLDCKNISEVHLPASIKRIETNAFARCTGLTKVMLSKGVEIIEACAFGGCTGLQTLVIPESVIKIEKYAFGNVPNIHYRGPAQSENNWGACQRNG